MDLAAEICNAVCTAYNQLPPHGKPNDLQYTALAGVVMKSEEESVAVLKVVSLATGTKCIGLQLAQSDASGCILCDSHAEILAKRGFQRYLLKCANLVLRSPETSKHAAFPLEPLPPSEPYPLRIKNNFKFFLFITDSPCGDASIYDISPAVGGLGSKAYTGAKRMAKDNDGGVQTASMSWIREEDSQGVGCMRFKSGRSDTLLCNRSGSKSCSDKICKWIHCGIQGMLGALLAPVPLGGVVVGRDPQSLDASQEHALRRALMERIQPTASGLLDPSTCLLMVVDMLLVCGGAGATAVLDIPVSLPSSSLLVQPIHAQPGPASSFPPSLPLCLRGVGLKLSTASRPDSGEVRTMPSPTSVNWVRNADPASLRSDVDDMEAAHKRSMCGIHFGSMEVVNGAAGVLEGATKKAIGKPGVASRLSRNAMLNLRRAVAYPPVPEELINSTFHELYVWFKRLDHQYVERVKRFLAYELFSNWKLFSKTNFEIASAVSDNVAERDRSDTTVSSKKRARL